MYRIRNSCIDYFSDLFVPSKQKIKKKYGFSIFFH